MKFIFFVSLCLDTDTHYKSRMKAIESLFSCQNVYIFITKNSLDFDFLVSKFKAQKIRKKNKIIICGFIERLVR